MKLEEVWPTEDVLLDEASLKNKLASLFGAGVIGAAALGGAGATKLGPQNEPVTITSPSSTVGSKTPQVTGPKPTDIAPAVLPVSQQTRTTDLDKSSSIPLVSPGGQPHRDFPKELQNQRELPGKERIETFVKHFRNYVKSVNQHILRDRATLQRIIKSAPRITKNDKEWLENQLQRYNATDAKDLLSRMDVIPPSLAIAQAGLESGWGTSDLSRQANAFFGQKSWSRSSGVRAPTGETYRSYTNPTQSVASYMLNLNSHPAYEHLRTLRTNLRRSGKPITGQQLVPALIKYSTAGTGYIDMLNKVISNPLLKRLD